jgi:phosphate transport system substrate-binding protein
MSSDRTTRRTLVRHLLLGAALPIALVASPALAQKKQTIVVTGASTIAPLMQEIAHRYEQLNPAVLIDVQTGGTSRGISDVRRKIADVGMASRALFPDEKDVAPYLLGRDGIAMIVHKTNPVATLSEDQVRQIYRGEATNWKAFGGNDAAITIVNKAEGRSTLDVFLAYTKLTVKEIKAHVVIGDNEQAIKVVTGNPRAIGYVSVGTAEYHIHNQAPLKMIGLGRVAPSTENVANGTYAAARELNLVTNGAAPPAPHVAAFLTFATSEKNHDLVREYFFVPPAK